MKRYIDAEKLIAEIERYENTAIDAYNPKGEDADFWHGKVVACEDLKTIVTSHQQDKDVLDLCSQVWWEDRGWIMIPPNVTLEGIDSLLKQVRKKLQQEQPSNEDDGKFVKISVRKEFAEQFQRLGDEIQAGQSSFIGAMNQQKQQEE